jgi:formylglycine-generating enzyme required for sulfatase activity
VNSQRSQFPFRLSFFALFAIFGTGLYACQSQPVSSIPPATDTIAPISTLPPEPTSTKLPLPESTPTMTALPTEIVDANGVPMVLIPGGAFEMGTENGDANESPMHTVFLDAFYMDQYEVTNTRYLACVQDGICSEQSATEINNPDLADYPMRNISWYEARIYCKWRGGQLPTEAQWEKAARGGLDGKLYPWGDDEPVCSFLELNGAKFDDGGDCHDTGSEPVGSYRPNGYGLYDMAGNLVEWTMDWLDEDYYLTSPAENPSGPERGQYKVVRGGSWHTEAPTLQVMHRYGVLPGFAYNLLGFRCVLPVSGR